MIQLGVDFGGTKIEAAALSESGEFLARVRAPNPGSYDAAIGTVCALVDRVEAAAGDAQTVGVGTPGSPSPHTGLIRNSNSVWLNGRNLKADLSAALGRPIRIANDANCLALSEAVDGAARDSKIAFAVIIGTGCGGGLVIDNQLVKGANRVSGEWGHIALPPTDLEQGERPQCWCGRSSCLEMWISGSGMQRDHRTRYGEQLTAEGIITQMRAGDSSARATFDRYVDRLGRGLGVVCNLLDPDTIVFGGGLSNVREIYAVLPEAIRPHVFSDTWSAALVPARWGDSSGVRGAARLWPLPPHDETLAITASITPAPPVPVAAANPGAASPNAPAGPNTPTSPATMVDLPPSMSVAPASAAADAADGLPTSAMSGGVPVLTDALASSRPHGAAFAAFTSEAATITTVLVDARRR